MLKILTEAVATLESKLTPQELKDLCAVIDGCIAVAYENGIQEGFDRSA